VLLCAVLARKKQQKQAGKWPEILKNFNFLGKFWHIKTNF